MDPDDWAPLPEDTVRLPEPTQRPAAPEPRARPPLLPRASRPPSSSPPTASERAAAEQALAAMQRRLAAQKPARTDPVRAAYHHATRKAVAATQWREELPPPPVVPAADRTSGIEGVAYATDRDPREDEPWFTALPTAEQQRLRQNWDTQRHRFDGQRPAYWRDVRRACWQGALVFFVVALLLSLLVGLGPLPALVFAGALAGVTGRLCGGGRFTFALLGGAAFMSVLIARLGVSVFSAFSLYGLIAATYGMGLLGLDREMQRSGGFAAADAAPPPRLQ